MTSAAKSASISRGWLRLVERFVLVTLVSLGGTTIVATSWARDMATPRVTLLGADRGVAALITTGAARVLILGGTDPIELGNAFQRAKHPGLDRIDVVIVSGNAAAADFAPRAIDMLHPRLVVAVGGSASLDPAGVVPDKIVQHTTEIELPDGVLLTLEVWPAADGENDDVTWAVTIERGGASVYWVADREALMQDELPEQTDVVVVGRGKPASDTPFPIARAIVAAGESITGPELRALALDAIGADTETLRVFRGETTRIDLNPAGIRSVDGGTLAATPVG